ncbi:Holliday junction resolvase [Desulfovibrio sp. X2]|uniref:Holliday junction resolvase RuvX n=1 Tax=Desulfovibrio sp. X2 TaxID=941449 RepID=UPI000358CAA5|nr:Holliday junction resolvase RuvX [Desulfovibrio sp. X2]EPR38663.1 Holliday junction resolvase [Desulfovibrio sp. X2]
MRALAIDFGTKKLGLALSDPAGRMALPRGILPRPAAGDEALFAELCALIGREGVDTLVVGLPLALDGSETETTRRAKKFGNRLAARAKLPVHFVDERLTSSEAKSRMREAGVRSKKAKARLDAEAAALILESFLACGRSAECAPDMPDLSGEDL